MGNFIPVEPEKWAEMVKAAASSDYWRIEAETDHARWLRTMEENEKLRAEVERLRKAGDEMALSLAAFHLLHRGKIDTTTQPDIVAWNAAKEGKIMSDTDHRPMSKAELEAYIADDFIPAMRKMLPVIAPLPEWQPIETAPRDGTDVLCISGEYMFVAWIDSRGYWNSGDDSRFVPDYWMYLPKPPAAKEGKPSV